MKAIHHPKELLELVQFESTIRDHIVDVSQSLTIELIDKGTKRNYKLNDLAKIMVVIRNGDKCFSCRMERPFIHQIGARIWKHEKTFLGVAFAWLRSINESFERFPNVIMEAFYTKELVIRYDPAKDDLNIYGIVTHLYKPSNQLRFREYFISEAKKTRVLDTSSPKIIKRQSGTVEERYQFNSNANSVRLECSIVYGRNTGYNSYKVRWYRKSIDDDLWFSPWESENNYEWKNNSHSAVDDFVSYLIKEGTEHQTFIDERVALAKKKDLSDDFIKFFMDKMLIAYATKDKIMNQYRISTETFGKTVWALSHSLRFVGTSDKYTGKSTKWLLLETGTLIFEKSYKDYLEAKEQIMLTGNYETYEKE